MKNIIISLLFYMILMLTFASHTPNASANAQNNSANAQNNSANAQNYGANAKANSNANIGEKIKAKTPAKPIISEQFNLKNGLQIVVVPQPNASAVTHMLLINAGAADDKLGSSGVAHYLEHLLFKGTKLVAEGDYSRIIDGLGGEHNAFTTSDITGYYVTIAPKYLPKIMELEADRMQNYAPSKTAYAKEKEVIIEERRMRTDNNPSALLGEAMEAAMFRHHPYGTPIIGWEHEMQQLGEAQASAFFKQYYNPTNATLLLVGDIDADKAQKLAQKYYGSWQAGAKNQRNWVKDPPRNTKDLLLMRNVNVSQPKMVVSYLAPSFSKAFSKAFATSSSHELVYSLLLAEELLGNERTGVLYQKLVKQQKLASNINISYYPFSLGDSSFNITAIPRDGVDLPQLQTALTAEINAFLAAEIDERALQRAKNQAKAQTIYAQDNLQGMSFLLATLHMVELPISWFNDYPTNIAKINQGQIKAALKEIINDDISVTGYLLPKK